MCMKMNEQFSMKITFILTIFFVCKTTKSEYLDLTYELNENIPTYPTPFLSPFSRKIRCNETQPEGYWLQIEDISSSIHVGTHVDAPCHFSKGKWCIHEIPFERLIAPAVVVDISSRQNNRSVSNLMPEDLENWQNIYGPISDGSVIILKCGWGKFWNDNDMYINGSEEIGNTPGVSEEAADWIVNNTNIYGIGVETVSVDERISHNFSAHVILQTANIYIIENLANVDKLPANGSIIYVMPVKITDGSGGHARVFAKLPDDANNF